MHEVYHLSDTPCIFSRSITLALMFPVINAFTCFLEFACKYTRRSYFILVKTSKLLSETHVLALLQNRKLKLTTKHCWSRFVWRCSRLTTLRILSTNLARIVFTTWTCKNDTAPYIWSLEMQIPLFVFPHAAQSAFRAVFVPHKNQMCQTPILLFCTIKLNTCE